MLARSELDRLSVVLVSTRNPLNIGAAARAMKTMGLARLVLVAPEKPLNEEAYRRSAGAEDVNGFAGKLTRVQAALHELEKSWPKGWAPDSLLDLSQTGNRMSIDPHTATEELKKFNEDLPKVIEEVRQLQDVDAKLVQAALAQLEDAQH